jgi:hypothetical protein
MLAEYLKNNLQEEGHEVCRRCILHKTEILVEYFIKDVVMELKVVKGDIFN